MKKCFKCARYKELRFFYRHPRMADGHLNKCKSCTKAYASAHYEANRNRYVVYEKKRYQKPERKSKAIEYQRKRRAAHPGKYKAHTAVSNAVRDGRLKRMPCEKCGAKAQAHHDDYRKPLDVRWLCRKHHLKEHGKAAY